jgi:hypothetical protein
MRAALDFFRLRESKKTTAAVASQHGAREAKRTAAAKAPQDGAPAGEKPSSAPRGAPASLRPAVQASPSSVSEAVQHSLATVVKPSDDSFQLFHEFEPAAKTIVLDRAWLRHTSLFRHTRTAAAAIASNPSLGGDRGAYDRAVVKCIVKAYRLANESHARQQTCAVHGGKVFDAFSALYGSVHGDKPRYLCWAVGVLAAHSTADSLVAKVAEVVDRAHRCSSAQKQAYNLLLVHAGRLSDTALHKDAPPTNAASSRLDTLDGAVARVHECFEDYLDDYKERAYASAFEEPARFYYDAIGDHGGRDHVNVHGTNWYAVALREALGVVVPLVPEEDDPHFMAVVEFWSGLTPAAWDQFKQRESLGKEFEGLAKLRSNKSRFVRTRVGGGPFDVRPPRQLGQRIRSDSGTRTKLALCT